MILHRLGEQATCHVHRGAARLWKEEAQSVEMAGDIHPKT